MINKMNSSKSRINAMGTIEKAKTKSEETVPERYGESRVVLLPRDPWWIFAYWELSEETNRNLRLMYGKDVFEKARLILRVYDVTGIKFNGGNARGYFDVVINKTADNWYINLPEINKDLFVDLAMILPDGNFITIERSNTISTPRYGVSPEIDEQWGKMCQEYERILKLSGIERTGKGSIDIVGFMRMRKNQLITSGLPRAHSRVFSIRRDAGKKIEKEF